MRHTWIFSKSSPSQEYLLFDGREDQDLELGVPGHLAGQGVARRVPGLAGVPRAVPECASAE